MATVPTAEPTVSNRPIGVTPQSNYAPAGAFGSGGQGLRTAAREFDQAGNELAAIAIKTQAQDNERVAKDADVEYSKRIRLALYGDGTAANPGFKSLQGENALAASGKVQQELDKARSEVLGGISNPKAQEMFGQVSAYKLEGALGDVASHTSQQRTVANTNSSNARMAEARDTAISDPSKVGQALATIAVESAAQAEDNGWGKDTAAVQAKKQTTALHTAIIEKMIDVDPIGAAAYYKQYGDQIASEAKPAIEKVLNEGVILGQSQKIADEVFAKYPNNPAAGLAEIKKLGLDPKLRDKALQEYLNEAAIARQSITQFRSDQEYADSQSTKDAKAKGYAAYQEAVGVSSDPNDPTHTILDPQGAFDAINNNEDLTQKEKDAAIDYLKEAVGFQNAVIDQATQTANNQYTIQKRDEEKKVRDATDRAFQMANTGVIPDADTLANMDPYKVQAVMGVVTRVKKGEPIVNDWGYYNELVTLAQTDPGQLALTSLAEAETKLLPEEFNQIKKLVTDAKLGKLNPEQAGSPMQLFAAYAAESGIRKTKDGKEYGRLQSLFFAEVNKQEEATKKAMTVDEMQTLLHKLGDAQILSPGFFGVGGTSLSLSEPPEDVASKIPTDTYNAIKAKLQSAGISDPTDAQIGDYYVRSKLPSNQGL